MFFDAIFDDHLKFSSLVVFSFYHVIGANMSPRHSPSLSTFVATNFNQIFFQLVLFGDVLLFTLLSLV